MVDSKEDILDLYLATIEEELEQAVKLNDNDNVGQLYRMLSYHMGWLDKSSKAISRGKRIRPLLVLLSCSAAGGDWMNALPASVAVEMVHNFSLIHDDIEDHSPLRRGRKTVWKKWGVAQAINAGDAMFTLAHLHLIRLNRNFSQTDTLSAVETLQHACLQLTHGQYLDLAFEKHDDVSIEEYWSMVEGKTGALISACCELGAICSTCNEDKRNTYREFGRLFGLAFQVQDDLLGIWGDSILTGKSNQSDLMSGKKTLPIIYGLEKGGEFAKCWRQGCKDTNDTKKLMKLLEYEGAKEFTHTKIIELIDQAIKILDGSGPSGTTGQILRDFSLDLSERKQ